MRRADRADQRRLDDALLVAQPEAGGDHARDLVRRQRARRRHEPLATVVALAGDERSIRAVERLLDEPLEERALVLDHEHLVQPGGELAHHPRVERVRHADGEHADVVDAEIAQRLQRLLRGHARRDDAETGARRRHDDPVELVQPRVLERQRQPDLAQRALELERVRGQQVRARAVDVRRALPLQDRRLRFTRPAPTCTAAVASATSVGTFSAAHNPEAREQAIA